MSNTRSPAEIAAAAEGILHMMATDHAEFVQDFEENLQRWGQRLQKDVLDIFQMPLPNGSMKEGAKVTIPKESVDRSPILKLISEELKDESRQVLDFLVEKANKDKDGWMDAAVVEANKIVMRSHDEAPVIFPIATEIYRGQPMVPGIIMNRYGGPFSFKDGIVRYHTTGLHLEPAFTVTFHQ